MTTDALKVTITGRTYSDVIGQARKLIEEYDGAPARGPTVTTRTKKTKPVETEETELLGATEETEELSLDGGTEDEGDLSFDSTEETTGKKTASKKLTDKDVNQAAMAHAKKNGRPATLKVLKGKFKVNSIVELKPDQYADVVKALKV